MTTNTGSTGDAGNAGDVLLNTASSGTALGEVIGFVTEFNTNVAIFEPLAVTVLLGVLEMMLVKPTINN